MGKHVKYLFNNKEALDIVIESFKSTEEKPVLSVCFGAKPETKDVEIDEETIKEPTGKWQLDILLHHSEYHNGEKYDVPVFDNATLLELDYEGNSTITGRSYLKDKNK